MQLTQVSNPRIANMKNTFAKAMHEGRMTPDCSDLNIGN